jgi:hypothetical protein
MYSDESSTFEVEIINPINARRLESHKCHDGTESSYDLIRLE